MNTPLVSILINNYNYGRFIRKAIDSALNQTYSNIEVIVVDDGSTDDSHQVIKSYGDKIISIFKQNGGQISAFNAGFAASKGEIICFLDSDDIFYTHKIHEVVCLFASYPDIGWVFHAYKDIDSETGRCLSIYPGNHLSEEVDFRHQITKGDKPTFAPATSSLCFSRQLLQLILPMPEVSAAEVSGFLLGDNYLKYAALFLKQGYFLNEVLTNLIVHGSNNYSRQSNKQWKIAIHDIYSAYYLQLAFPDMRIFTNRLFGIGLGNYWCAKQQREFLQKRIDGYFSHLSLDEKFQVILRASYHYFNSSPALRPILDLSRSLIKEKSTINNK